MRGCCLLVRTGLPGGFLSSLWRTPVTSIRFLVKTAIAVSSFLRRSVVVLLSSGYDPFNTGLICSGPRFILSCDEVIIKRSFRVRRSDRSCTRPK